MTGLCGALAPFPLLPALVEVVGGGMELLAADAWGGCSCEVVT